MFLVIKGDITDAAITAHHYNIRLTKAEYNSSWDETLAWCNSTHWRRVYDWMNDGQVKAPFEPGSLLFFNGMHSQPEANVPDEG